MHSSLQSMLSPLGFSAEEVQVYSALLESGPSTAGALSRRLGVVRSSLYGILKRLQDGGLVLQSQIRGVKQFRANDPDRISLLFGERLDALREQQEMFAHLLPVLRTKRASTLLKPTLQIVEGEEGMRNILKDMLLYRDIETQSLWPIRQMIDVLSPEFFRYLNQVRVENNLYTRAIWPAKQTVDIAKHPYLGFGEAYRREIRVAPEGIDCAMGYWIYGQKVVFISSRREAFGFTLESAELVELLRTQFELLWTLSKPIQAPDRA
ncbi:MAG TPA: helix-turn-helix domain-containing protein [Candidatus Peribacteria bacterium]|nr:helix-turn-helix domain-containing protein [Candidatus Peribacteria bacterium]